MGPRSVTLIEPMADSDFHSIRVATLRGDNKIPFDIYVRVAGKYILYCRSGESFEGTRLERLRAKKLKKMFIKTDDQIPYDQYLEQSVEQAFDSKSRKTLEVRAQVIQGFQQATAEAFMENPQSESLYHHLSSTAQRFVEFVSREPDAAKPILAIENTDMSITHHSVNVAVLTILMALNSEFKNSTKLHLLGLGCMMHDIDLFHTWQDYGKPVDQLSPAELAAYKLHPKLGAGRLQNVGFIDQIVMNVITQHEEYIDGSGFPKGLVGKEIEPVVLLAAVANAYDRLVSFQRLSPKEAQKTLMIDKLGLYPLEHMKNLTSIIRSLNII